MEKALLRFLALALIFFGLFLAMKQIDWMRHLRVEKISQKTEEKLGELVRDLFLSKEQEITRPEVRLPVDSLFEKLCRSSDLDPDEYRLYVVDNPDINAFAMPGRHIVIYRGLIDFCENESELAGVLGHELAHLELNHVMKKLIKELGLTVLVSIGAGDGGVMVREVLRHLSSSAFDRHLEKEADLKAIEYLFAADIDPEGLGHFMYRLAETPEGKAARYLTWVSTHPDPDARSRYILDEIAPRRDREFTPVLHDSTWTTLKTLLIQAKLSWPD
jgi:predicted Zn-dependent protease